MLRVRGAHRAHFLLFRAPADPIGVVSQECAIVGPWDALVLSAPRQALRARVARSRRDGMDAPVRCRV